MQKKLPVTSRCPLRTGTPASVCAPRKLQLIGRFGLCRGSGGLYFRERVGLGVVVTSDGGKVDGVGQGARPAGIYAGRQLGRAEAISGEDLCV